jgi:hypothetical protein
VVSKPEDSDEWMFWLAQDFCRERLGSLTLTTKRDRDKRQLQQGGARKNGSKERYR